MRAGTFNEEVRITSGGTGTHGTLLIRPFPGEVAVLDGTGQTPNGEQGLIDISSRSNVTIEGLEIRNYRSNASNTPIGIFVHGRGSGVRITGNHVHDIVQTAEGCPNGNAFGIAVFGDNNTSISNIVIERNEVNGLRTGCSESVVLNGNVDGFQIVDNSIHDNDNIGIDIIGFEGMGPNINSDQARNGVIRGNRIYNITSFGNPAYGTDRSADGIYVDGGKNVLIENNLVRNVDIGIEVASETQNRASSYVLVRNNLVYFSNSAGLSIGGYDAQRGRTENTVFINNTLYENATELQVQFYVSTTRYQNNLVYNAGGGFTTGTLTGVTQQSNVTRSADAGGLFVNPGTPPNGGVAVDLHVVSSAPGVIGQGTELVSCPGGWTCPTVWTTPLHGTVDMDGGVRVLGAIDIGAYEQ